VYLSYRGAPHEATWTRYVWFENVGVVRGGVWDWTGRILLLVGRVFRVGVERSHRCLSKKERLIMSA
jgi:hypothetical protein